MSYVCVLCCVEINHQKFVYLQLPPISAERPLHWTSCVCSYLPIKDTHNPGRCRCCVLLETNGPIPPFPPRVRLFVSLGSSPLTNVRPLACLSRFRQLLVTTCLIGFIIWTSSGLAPWRLSTNYPTCGIYVYVAKHLSNPIALLLSGVTCVNGVLLV